MRTWRLLIGSLAAFLAASGALAESVTLAPTSSWVVDYGDDSCALSREFGGPDDPVYLELRQYEPGDTVQFMIATDAFRQRDRAARIRILPDEEARVIESPLSLTTENYGGGFVFSGSLRSRDGGEDGRLSRRGWTDAQREAREREIAGIAFAGIFRSDFVLETGSVHNAMTVMRDCVRNLVEVWGYDAQVESGLTRRARPVDFAEWRPLISNRYPDQLEQSGKQALVKARLRISAEGKALECRVLASINDPTFDETACEVLLEHGRFEAALDSAGQPVESFDILTLVYRVR